MKLRGLFIFFFSFTVTGMAFSQKPIDGGKANAIYISGDYETAAKAFKEIADSWKNQPVKDSFYYYTYAEGKALSMLNNLDGSQATMEFLFEESKKLKKPPEVMGKAYLVYGTNLVYLEAYDQSLAALKSATDYETSLENPDQKVLARINQWKGYANLYLGNFDIAEKQVLESHRLRTEIFDSDNIELGISFSMLGNFYFDTYQWQKCFEAQEEAIRIFRLHVDDNHINMGMMYNNQSNVVTNLGNPDLGKVYLEKAIQSNLAGERAYLLPLNYGNLADLYLSLNDYSQAEIYWRKAIRILDESLERSGFTWANQHDGLGGIMMYTKQYAKADSLFRISLKAKEELYGKSHPEVSQSLYNIGLNAMDWGKYKIAESFLLRSEKMRRQTLGAKHPKWAASNSELAQLEWHKGLRQQAITKWEQSLEVCKNHLGLSNDNTLKTINRLANAYIDQNNYPKAYEALKLGWAGACGKEKSFEDLSDLKKSKIEFYQSSVLDLSETHLRYLTETDQVLSYENAEIANEVARLTYELVSVLAPLQSSAYQSTELANQVNRIVNYISLLNHKFSQTAGVNLNLSEQLLKGVDKSRAVTIQSAFHERQALEFGGIPDSLVEQGRIIGERLRYAKSRKMRSEDTNVNWDSLEFASLRTWSDYQNNLKQNFPNYYQAKFNNPEISLENLQNVLKAEKKGLLIYFDLDSVIIALTVNRHAIKSHRLDMPEGWADSLLVFRNQIETPGNNQRKYRLANQLYKILWQPLEKDLSDEVIIIPDGNLHYLNFEILLKSPYREGGTGRDADWLIRSYTIHYANHLPGAAFSPEHLEDANQILGVAPGFSEELKANYLRNLSPENPEDSIFMNWVRTPWSQAFVEELGKRFKASTLIGDSATESAFKSTAPEAGILHFGTHAQLEDREPLLSFLAMTPQSNGEADGYLHAYELYNQPLNARLAVLAACKTGLGRYQNGEGVLSLAHAFRYAGCPSVVYSLWSIDDQQSNILLDAFYANLGKNQPFSQALRAAKLNYLKTQPEALLDPFYWGGMVLTGESTTLHKPTLPSRWIWWGGALLMAFLLGLFLLKAK